MVDGSHTGPAGRRIRPVPTRTELPQYNYTWLLYVLAAVLAVGLAYVIYQLNYGYGQAPHRILKILLGVAVFTIAFFKPWVALHAWLLALPLGELLPVTGIPGVNGPNLILMMMVVSWILPRVLRGEPLIMRTRLMWPIAFFLAVFFLSYLKATFFPPIHGSFPAMMMLRRVWQSALGLSVYYIVANTVKDRKQLTNLLVTFGIGCSFGVLVAIRQLGTLAAHKRVVGAMGDVNDLAAYMAMCASMLVALFLAGGGLGWLKRTAILASAGLAMVGTFLPKSRGALLGIAAGLGLLTLKISKRAFVVFLVILALSPFWVPSSVKERVMETRSDTVEAGLFGDPSDRLDPSAAIRLEIWGIVLKEFVRNPIFGLGYATVPLLTLARYGRTFSSHSLYVATAGESGLLGLFALTWLIVSCIKSGRELLARATHRIHRGLSLGFLAATAALLVANIFGQRFLHMTIAGTYFFLAGLVDRGIYFEKTSNALGEAERS